MSALEKELLLPGIILTGPLCSKTVATWSCLLTMPLHRQGICNCKKFESFQVNLLKKKKIVTDIAFLDEKDIKDDSLAWNCLNVNKYSKKE